MLNFLRRKGIVLRKITSTGRDLPANSPVVIKGFFKNCDKIIEDGYTNDQIINMDETSIYLDFPSNYTYERKGAKRVKSVTTGGGRVRVSAAFTATASGIKLPILVLIPRKTPLPNFQPPPNVCIIYKQSATFDQHVICQYLDTIIKPYMISKDFDKLAILLDSAKCHSTAPVTNKLKELNVLKVQIP